MNIDPIDLRNARLAAGLTIEQAAELVGMTFRGWQDNEKGLRRVNPAVYRLFLHLAGLEELPFDIIRGAGNAKTGAGTLKNQAIP